MEQFPALLRAPDQQPIRYLVVDDSVFARKNLARIIECYGGELAGEAGDGRHRHRRIRPHPGRHRADGHHHAADGRHRGRRAHRAQASRCPHHHGLQRRLPGEHRRRSAEGRPPLRAEAGQAGAALRGHQVRAGRRRRHRRRRRQQRSSCHEDGADSTLH